SAKLVRRLVTLPQLLEQFSQIDTTARQPVPVVGLSGELGGELLPVHQRLAVLTVCLSALAEVAQDVSKADPSGGDPASVAGHRGEGGRERRVRIYRRLDRRG